MSLLVVNFAVPATGHAVVFLAGLPGVWAAVTASGVTLGLARKNHHAETAVVDELSHLSTSNLERIQVWVERDEKVLDLYPDETQALTRWHAVILKRFGTETRISAVPQLMKLYDYDKRRNISWYPADPDKVGDQTVREIFGPEAKPQFTSLSAVAIIWLHYCRNNTDACAD